MSDLNALFASWLLALVVTGLPQLIAWILYLRREEGERLKRSFREYNDERLRMLRKHILLYDSTS